jgi:NTE family protein
MLDGPLDVFRLRQYFNAVTQARAWADGLRHDAGLARDLRRAVVRLPFDATARAHDPFPTGEPCAMPRLTGRRVALMATGGSGALASLVGVARALEEGGVQPSVISLCSGSALFGFPLGAGLSASDVARFVLGLDPNDYVDVDWRALAALGPTLGRGFAGLLRGDAIEAAYRKLLGDRRLADLEIPTYAPIWNVEENRLQYLGPRTHPEMTVARAVRMAIALPLLIAPVDLDGQFWCDGGIVDIFPVHPVLDIEPPCDVAVAINGFYPAGFEGEDATGWQDRPVSIVHVAGQVRSCQQIELARENLTRLRAAADVVMLEPVPYHVVRGVGFYRQFLSTRDWPAFMTAGRACAHEALARRGADDVTAVA